MQLHFHFAQQRSKQNNLKLEKLIDYLRDKWSFNYIHNAAGSNRETDQHKYNYASRKRLSENVQLSEEDWGWWWAVKLVNASGRLGVRTYNSFNLANISPIRVVTWAS